MNTKPRLKIISDRVVEIPARETPAQAARRRHGKPFASESGSTFKWHSGPSVSDAWLHRRKQERDK